MLPSVTLAVFTLTLAALPWAEGACVANTSSSTDLQSALTQGGPGHILSLCPGQVYKLQGALNYTAANQEISTEGYPTDSSRATLLISGFNVTTAVRATDAGLSGSKLRNVQINGNRGDEAIYISPGANIEFGGDNANQLVEFVKTYDPRGWSCLHVAEGPFSCRNATIQYNDIGPCGSQSFQQWADGISLSCQSSLVQHNRIVDATDGGIVIFGSPYSNIRNNTIWVETRTLLGGINMVDPVPWRPEGNFSGVVVEENKIYGGFATGVGNGTLGPNNASAIIKVGLGIGPRVWFSDDRYGTNQTEGAIVRNNEFSGAFSFAMMAQGVSSAENFTIEGNSFVGNVSFIGSYGPNCTAAEETPHPPTALLLEPRSTDNLRISVPVPEDRIASAHPDTRAFVNGTANGLICFNPPRPDQNLWPYGGQGLNASPTGSNGNTPTPSSDTPEPSSTGAGSRDNVPLATSILGLAGSLLVMITKCLL